MELKPDVSILFCKHSDVKDLIGDITSHICDAINDTAPNEGLGAQKIRGLWVIGVRSTAAKLTLLRTNLIINNTHIKLYDTNPYDLKSQRVDGERIVFKDLPLWESSSLIEDFLKTLPHVGEFSQVYLSKARDNKTNRQTQYLNGDRYVFLKLDPENPFPTKCVLGGYPVRIWYAAQRVKCKRCGKSGHKTDSKKCPQYIESPPENYVLFKNGPFSNFSAIPVVQGSTTFSTSEHCYQWHACTEHLRDDLAERVLRAQTPREAKTIASEVKQKDSPWDEIKYSIMKNVLISKIASSTKFRDNILESGDSILVEALADPWWGCGLPYHIAITTHPDFYPGKNKLGQLLMELRTEMRTAPEVHPFVASPENYEPKPLRSRKLKKTGSQIRSSSLPLRGKPAKSVTPLIIDMFDRQARKRARLSSSSNSHVKDTDFDDAASMTSFVSAIDVEDMDDDGTDNR